jgi:hypothetical protein
MRAYSCARITFAIIVVMAVCVSGVAMSPSQGLAMEPNYKMVSASSGGGTSGGGEWKTNPDQSGQLPLNEKGGGSPSGPAQYTQQVGTAVSWAQKVETAIVRVVRFVGATFSKLY